MMIELDEAQPNVQSHIATAEQAQQFLADLEQYVEYYQDGLLSADELAEAKQRILQHSFDAGRLVAAR